MKFFDAHCDILSVIDKPDELFLNNYHWDCSRALLNGPFIQVFSLFSSDERPDIKKMNMEAQLAKILEAENSFSHKLKIIRSINDLEECIKVKSAHKVYGFLEAEGAEIINGSLNELKRLYNMGLRILTLSWNQDNDICDSVAGEYPHNGLSSLGKEVIEKAELLGILIDVSHASDKTFEDVMAISRKPITASHSNARAVCGHRRNLTDSQILDIARIGGVIGINFCPSFIEKSGNADLLGIIRHIEYISALAGPHAIGLGADFDGIDNLPGGISGVEDVHKIVEELLRLNYSEEDVKGIAGGNFINLMRKIL
jgi:membrane dipeptidase